MSEANNLPKRCSRCPRGAFNDYWCVWAETKCYKDSVMVDRINNEERKRERKV